MTPLNLFEWTLDELHQEHGSAYLFNVWYPAFVGCYMTCRMMRGPEQLSSDTVKFLIKKAAQDATHYLDEIVVTCVP